MFWTAKNGVVILGNTQMNYVRFGHGNRTLVILPGLSDGLATVKGKALLLAKPYVPFLIDTQFICLAERTIYPKATPCVIWPMIRRKQ